MLRLLAVCLVGLMGCSKPDTTSEPAHPTFTFPQVVLGTSMLPTYGDGEVVLCDLVPYSSLKSSDTVIRWDSRITSFTHHRIVGWNASLGLWETKGDNNATADRAPLSSVDFIARTHKLNVP